MKPFQQTIGRRIMAAFLALALCLGTTALAAEVHGKNPAGTYRTALCNDLFYVDWLCSDLNGDRALGANYGPGSGYNRYASGEAVLVDTPLKKSFSATVTADCLWSFDRNARPEDAYPASTFQIELTKLDRVIDSRAEWVGRFTVRQDGKPLFVNEPGKLVHVPSLDGTQLTDLTIGPDGIHYFYARFNFGLTGTQPMDGAAAARVQVQAVESHPDTIQIETRQKSATYVDGFYVVPFFWNDFCVNDTLGTLSCYLLLEVERYSSRFVPATSAYAALELRPQDVTSYDGDQAAGTFLLILPNGQDREFTGTIRGLDGNAGDVIRIQADDGSLSVDFTIERDRRYQPEEKEIEVPEGLDAENAAKYLFHETATITRDKVAGTDTMPFSITSQGNTVTIAYTGDPKYRAGARLMAGMFGDWRGIRSKADCQRLDDGPVTFQLPEEASYLGLDLFQVDTKDGADYHSYDMTLYRTPDGAIAADCSYYGLYNPNYSGAAAEAGLSDGLVLPFMQQQE